jgi:hypothetical protein
VFLFPFAAVRFSIYTMSASSTSQTSHECTFCGRHADLAVTSFDTLVPLGPPVSVCRFCMGRPHRREKLGENAHRVRLSDISSGKAATGHPSQLVSLLSTLNQQLGQRTITAAIRVSSYAVQPIELVCAACSGAVIPAKGGVIAWQDRADGTREEARVLHGSACAAESGRPLQPGCWEELDQLSGLDITRFDHESMSYLTDVEIAWQRLREG